MRASRKLAKANRDSVCFDPTPRRKKFRPKSEMNRIGGLETLKNRGKGPEEMKAARKIPTGTQNSRTERKRIGYLDSRSMFTC